MNSDSYRTDSDIPASDPAADASERRISFERLRERTDELELILSGLFAFALLATPSWLFTRWAEASVHATGAWDMVLTLCFMFGTGLCYSLGGFFLVHLCVRGYWVSLIGLKASFSRGIRWDAVGTMGPVSRDYYQRRLPDLLHSIDRADRAGSVLFAIATLIAIMLLWVTAIILAVILLGAALGQLLGDTGRGIAMVYAVFMVLVLGCAVLLFVIDVMLIKRWPQLQHKAMVRRLLNGMLSFYGFIIPQRLIMPVQLTLQSNLPAWVFVAFLSVVTALAPGLGLLYLNQSRSFAPGGSYTHLDGDSVELGMRSAHYENLRSQRDQLLRLPMIPADLIDASHLRLFLPHIPDRDQELLAQRCPTPVDAQPGRAERMAQQVVCLAGLWKVTLNDSAADVSGFLPSERRDLGLRGLQGYLPMQGLQPGRQDLRVTWNPDGPETGDQKPREYHIPFWFSPGYEAAVDQPDKPTPVTAPPTVEPSRTVPEAS